MSWNLSADQLRQLSPEDWSALVAKAVAEVRQRNAAPSWWQWRASYGGDVETTCIRMRGAHD